LGFLVLDVANRRWIRILFGREFPLEDTLLLWDALFAFNQLKPLELVDYVALAMITDIRDARSLHYSLLALSYSALQF